MILSWHKAGYVASGLFKRAGQTRICPSCGSHQALRVDRKGFHGLYRCDACALQYRWPYETPEEMARFYQHHYSQPGLTTDLPDADALNALLKSGFRGSSKDFSRVIELLGLLLVPQGSRILDFGANWGYGVWQFRQAGFDAVGYELSEARSAFGTKLGVGVFSEWAQIEARGPFDVVFSSHVLEHTPDPAAALRRKAGMLVKGGLLIAYFPNGSAEFRSADPTGFHRLWGRVHPVMLDGPFLRRALPEWPLVLGAHTADDLARLHDWDRISSWSGNLSDGELMMIAVSPLAR